MARPLGLPVGSVRAICLLGLTARTVLDLRADRPVAPWLAAALLISATTYFASRAARHGVHTSPTDPFAGTPPRHHHPLGFPAGTVRVLFLGLVGYGTWLWFHHHPGIPAGWRGVIGVVTAFFVGALVRWFLNQVRRPDDASTLVFEHAQGLAAVVSALGLVAISVFGPDVEVAGWVPPALAAFCSYYAGVR